MAVASHCTQHGYALTLIIVLLYCLSYLSAPPSSTCVKRLYDQWRAVYVLCLCCNQERRQSRCISPRRAAVRTTVDSRPADGLGTSIPLSNFGKSLSCSRWITPRPVLFVFLLDHMMAEDFVNIKNYLLWT
jgi:hypothetical protein